MIGSLFGTRLPTQQASPHMDGVAVKVITRPVRLTPNDRVFEGVGTGRARMSVAVYPAVDEEVREVRFSAQESVSRGQVLVQLDDRAERLAIKLAEVELKDARSLLARYEEAGSEGAVPESEVDSARAAFEGAEVALEQARLALEYRQIKAPFDGIVGIPNVDPGDRVTTSTLITGLDARDILYVDFEIPEALAVAPGNVQDGGQAVTARTPAYPGVTFSGSIVARESRVHVTRRTMRVRASIENEKDLLRPGMSFAVRWEIPGESYPTVPEISLQWGRDGSFVWIIRENKAVKVPARVVARNGSLVLLEGDIVEGEAVVVEGLQRLGPGDPVEILGTSGQ